MWLVRSLCLKVVKKPVHLDPSIILTGECEGGITEQQGIFAPERGKWQLPEISINFRYDAPRLPPTSNPNFMATLLHANPKGTAGDYRVPLT